MPTFDSYSALQRYLEKEGWNLAKTPSGKTLADILKEEAKRLKECLEKAIGEYYLTPYSGIVSRTEDLKNSLQIDKLVKINISSGTLSIGVNFDEDMIKAESIFGSDSSAYNTAVLINDGWEVKKDVWFKEWEHFGWQDGNDYISRALQYFYADNPYNLKVDVQGFRKKYD